MAPVVDNFTRADNASTMGSAPTGQTWAPATGTWGIASNRARSFGPGGTAYTTLIESGDTGDFDGSCVLVQGTGGTIPGFLFWSDSDANRLGIFLNVGSNIVALFKNDGGATTTIDSEVYAGGTLVVNTDYLVRVTINATTGVLEAFVNGVSTLNYTLTAPELAKYLPYTKVGLRGSPENRYDDLVILGAGGVVDLAGSASSASGATGAPQRGRNLAGTASSASSASGGLTVTGAGNFAGQSAAASALTAAMARDRRLAAACSSASGATGALRVTRPLAGVIAAASALTAQAEQVLPVPSYVDPIPPRAFGWRPDPVRKVSNGRFY